MSDVGVVKIENRGKNLWKYTPQQYIDNFTSPHSYYYDAGDVLYVGMSAAGYGFPFLVVKPNTVYTFQCEKLDNKQFRVELSTFSGKFLDKTFTNSGIVKFTFTAPNDIIFVKLHNSGDTPSTPVTNFMLIEGDYTNQELDYEPPRSDYIEFNQELFGYAGIYDELQDDGTLIKRWKRETGRTITSGAGQVSSSGTGTCILINETTGLPYEGTVSSTSISTSAPDGTYTVIYQLATPEVSKIAIKSTMQALRKGHNQFIATEYELDTFTGDGTTTTFNLTKTANSTSYIVKVSGKEVTDGITKTTASITFDTPPRNGAIIEVYYNPNYFVPAVLSYEIEEPSGTQETLSQFTALSITENDDVVTARLEDGTYQRVVKARDYTVTLNKALIENYENFIQKYRDKKFRLIITNLRDSSQEILAICEFETKSKDYFGGSESVTLRCSNLYD